jgi:hypothetical protein
MPYVGSFSLDIMARELPLRERFPLTKPSSEEYWHIGDTTMRFSSVTVPTLYGAKRWEGWVMSLLADCKMCPTVVPL